MLVLNLPMVDILTEEHPFRLAVSGGNGRIRMRLRLTTPGAEPVILENEAQCPDGAPVTLEVTAAQLMAGEYHGHLTCESAGHSQTWPVNLFRMPRRRDTGVPFGIYAVTYPEDAAAMDALLAEVRATGIDLLCNHMNGLAQERHFLNRAARHGLAFCPSSGMARTDEGQAVEWPDEFKIAFAPGAPSAAARQPCFNRPEVRRRAARHFGAMARQYAAHPLFSGLIYYGDDLFMQAQNVMGTVWLSCYCRHCRHDFRERFGIEPPQTTTHHEGVVPASDPWLLWMRYRCENVYGDFIGELDKAMSAAAPAAALGLCHGWPDNPFSNIATGIYTPLSQRHATAISSYFYPFLRSPVQDHICHYEFAKMGNRHKPVWMLGLFLADGVASPDWQITLNYWNMLAAGYNLIAFFSWWDYGRMVAENDARRQAAARRALATLARCGRHREWILPAAAHWHRPPARAAALYSFTTEAFDIAPSNQNHRHLKEVCRLYRATLAQQAPLNLVSEDDIRNGMLSNYDALCLHDVRVLPDDVHAIIQAFAASGKAVYCDIDYLYADGWHPDRKVTVKGAIEMAPESMAQVLADTFPAPCRLNNPDITVRTFKAGKIDYHVFVNNYTDRYHGMTYTYGDTDSENMRRASLVQARAAESEIIFAIPGQHLFDMSSGRALGATDQPLKLTLQPAWGAVLVALPCAGATLKATGPKQAAPGSCLSFAIEFCAPDGTLLDGAFTAHAAITRPNGQADPHSGFFAVVNGRHDFTMPMAENAITGAWLFAFSGGFPRQRVVHKTEVRPQR